MTRTLIANLAMTSSVTPFTVQEFLRPSHVPLDDGDPDPATNRTVVPNDSTGEFWVKLPVHGLTPLPCCHFFALILRSGSVPGFQFGSMTHTLILPCPSQNSVSR